MIATAVVNGGTPVSDKSTTSTSSGSVAGARAWLAVLAPAGIVPSSWNGVHVNGPTTIIKHLGPYTLNVSPGIRFGTISWPPNSDLTFNWNTSGILTNVQSGLTGKAKIDTVGPGPDIVNAVMSVPRFLTTISNPALWKRVGIGAAGVAILVVALVIVVKKEVIP